MDSLVASVQIDASPADVFAFFEYMNERRYRAWHPEDHVGFGYVSGDRVSDGTVVAVEESIDGERRTTRYEFTAVVPGHVVDFRPASGVRRLLLPDGRLEFRNSGAGCHFVHRVDVRMGRVVDRSERIVRRLAAIDRHMHESCEHLKTIVENGHVQGIDAGEDPVALGESAAQQVNVQTP